MNKGNLYFERERFQLVNNYYGKHAKYPSPAQTAQLRFEIPLETGRGNYEVQTNLETAIKRATETYLKANDLFVAKSIGMGLLIEKDNKKGQGVLFSYPVLHSAAMPAGYVGLKTNDAEAIYNGTLEVVTGNKVTYRGIPIRRFRNVPETQPVQIQGDDGLTTAGIIPQMSSDDCMLDLPEVLSFAGTKDQTLRVSFRCDTAANFAPAVEGYTSFLTIIVDGWLVEGGTNANYKEPSNPFANFI